MRYIEYFGLPGSGKTTKLKSYKEIEGYSYYINGKPISDKCDDIPLLKKRILPWIIVDCLKTIVFCLKHRIINKSVLRFVLAAQNLRVNLHVFQNIDILIVNDNGYMQLLVSIIKRMPQIDNERFVKDYIGRFLDSRQKMSVVYLCTDYIECLDRIYKRGKYLSIIEDDSEKTKENLLKEVQLFELCYATIDSWCVSRSNWNLSREECR